MDLFDNLNEKIKMIDESMKLIAHKSSLSQEITEVHDEVNEIKSLKAMIDQIFTESKDHLLKEYEELKEMISKVTRFMLFTIEEIEKRSAGNERREVLPIPLLQNQAQSSAFTPQSVSRMAVTMYSKSPLIKKKTKSLMFTDFKYEIKEEEFSSLPSYMRGRITKSELQDFLDNVLIKSFNAKYEIFYKNRACLKSSDVHLQQTFQSQAAYFEGEFFVTLGDLARIQNRNIDKKEDKYLQNLRHLKIIKEARKNQAICYIWIKPTN